MAAFEDHHKALWRGVHQACMPAHMPAPPDTVSNAKYDVTNPPITRKTTWMTSVQDTALNPPYKL